MKRISPDLLSSNNEGISEHGQGKFGLTALGKSILLLISRNYFVDVQVELKNDLIQNVVESGKK